VSAQDVVGGFAEHGDCCGCGEDEYWCAGVDLADAEVVDAAAVAQGEFAELVDGVVAQAEVSGGLTSRMTTRALDMSHDSHL